MPVRTRVRDMRSGLEVQDAVGQFNRWLVPAPPAALTKPHSRCRRVCPNTSPGVRAMFQRFTTLSLCVALAACTSVQARPLVDVGVVDRDRGYAPDGGWLGQIHHRGQDWIEGEPGHRYSVRLTNTSGGRVLVVLSVDGINAVTGQTAHPSQAGYVLEPWESTEISGWRKSLDDVAQFVFTDLPDSYAARTGRPDNVGVIGIAVFREARPIAYAPPTASPPWTEDSRGNQAPQAKSAAPAAESSAADAYGDVARQRIGTGHGAREWSPVGQ